MAFKYEIKLVCERYGEYKTIHFDEVFETLELCKQAFLAKLSDFDFPDCFGHPYVRILVLGEFPSSFVYCPFDCEAEHVNFGEHG